MNELKGYQIDCVSHGSPASTAGVKAGWKLLRIDNQPVSDIIDYKILEADLSLRLLLQTEKGILRRVKIDKPADIPLGLSFDPPTMSEMQRCGNKCIFCFIDQNPSGLRQSLYVKDDDYRMSFIYGNFITLNRLTDWEIERIIKLQLSPLYVSVHTTNPILRRKIFGTKRADNGLRNLKCLSKAGIRIHAQIVLCPGYNTGSELERTIKDLNLMGSNLSDIALVPVGLTAHRSGLPKLEKFESEEAKLLILQVEKMQQKFLKSRGSRFIFLADEFYSLTESEFPGDSEYEGYPQLENGVGLARQFLNELTALANMELSDLERNISVTIAVGRTAGPLLKQLAEVLVDLENLKINLVIVENHFLGKPVTVSGLLSGSDLQAALEGKDLGDGVFIANTLLREDSEIFLDDMTIKELEQTIKSPVYPVSGPLEMLAIIREFADVSRFEL